MKYSNILRGLLITLIGTAVNAGTISGTGTIPSVKSLSTECFENGGFEYHYDPTPGSIGRVCIKRNSEESAIIQSTNPDCPVGSIENYEVVLKCYNSLLQWGKMFYEASTGTIKEYEPYIQTDNTKSTKTVPDIEPSEAPVVDDKNDGCSTKVVTLINNSSAECFKLGGNIYYYNSKPRVCQVPNEVCVLKVDKVYEIIDSNFMTCRVGDIGTKKELKKCIKTIKKWNKIENEEYEEITEEITDDFDEEEDEE